MPLTYLDLKETIVPETWDESMTGLDETTLGERFLTRARVWARSFLAPCGVTTLDEDGDEFVREAILARAQYEFYAYFEKESLAEDKKELAEEILRGVYGPCAGGLEPRERGVFHPYVYVTEPSDSWRGFKA